MYTMTCHFLWIFDPGNFSHSYHCRYPQLDYTNEFHLGQHNGTPTEYANIVKSLYGLLKKSLCNWSWPCPGCTWTSFGMYLAFKKNTQEINWDNLNWWNLKWSEKTTQAEQFKHNGAFLASFVFKQQQIFNLWLLSVLTNDVPIMHFEVAYYL